MLLQVCEFVKVDGIGTDVPLCTVSISSDGTGTTNLRSL